MNKSTIHNSPLTINCATRTYNPDVLSCLANLSNDEVFTPPEVANAMLDLLPQEIFENPQTTFLDPACKSGVFLREIAKRLIKGLEPKIPNLKKRIKHIFKNQLYGISITELTSLLSRRSVYCSKYANSKFSVCDFETNDGNIRFKKTQHLWINGKCLHCGASQAEYGKEKRGEDLETHAYEFIHTDYPEEIFKMKFDVIIGNPPYQMGVGNEGGNSSKAKAIYHHFIEQAQKLNPRYLIMITPSRWMTRSVEGIPDQWIDKMLSENHFKVIHDFEDSSDCFPGVSIMGGVNYFLIDSNYTGKCFYNYHTSANKNIYTREASINSFNSGLVIRNPNAYKILEKLNRIEKKYYQNEDNNFSNFVSPKDFFTNKQTLTSSWTGFKNQKEDNYSIKYYLNKSIHKKDFGWIKKDDISKNHDSIKLNKVYIPAAGGSGNDDKILGSPFYGEPNSVCSQTYLVIGYDPIKHNFTKEQCENIISYIKTRFFRYLVSIKKKTQNGPRGVYQFVPLQDFTSASDIDWSRPVPEIDKQLYAKYGLSQEEIDFIESMIRPME